MNPTQFLTDETIRKVHSAALMLGLDRDVLLSGMPPQVPPTLPTAPDPGSQLLVDLNILSRMELTDGSRPIKSWLESAELLAGDRVEGQEFTDALGELSGVVSDRAGKVVVPGPVWPAGALAVGLAAGWLAHVLIGGRPAVEVTVALLSEDERACVVGLDPATAVEARAEAGDQGDWHTMVDRAGVLAGKRARYRVSWARHADLPQDAALWILATNHFARVDAVVLEGGDPVEPIVEQNASIYRRLLWHSLRPEKIRVDPYGLLDPDWPPPKEDDEPFFDSFAWIVPVPDGEDAVLYVSVCQANSSPGPGSRADLGLTLLSPEISGMLVEHREE